MTTQRKPARVNGTANRNGTAPVGPSANGTAPVVAPTAPPVAPVVTSPPADWQPSASSTLDECIAFARRRAQPEKAKCKIALAFPNGSGGVVYGSVTLPAVIFGDVNALASAAAKFAACAASLPDAGGNYTDASGKPKPVAKNSDVVHGGDVAPFIASRFAPAM
jgi:hypothetical protein